MKFLVIGLMLASAQTLDFGPGDVISPGLPQVTSWHFVEIDGKSTHLSGDLLQDDNYAIDFYPGSFVGYGGCDRFSGTFTRKGDLVTIQPAGSTRNRCSAAIMSLEGRLYEILSSSLRVSAPDKESLLLTSNKGAVRLKRTFK